MEIETAENTAVTRPKRLLGGVPWKTPAPSMNKPGVYQILNLVNGKRYIGSASNCVIERWRNHKKDLRGDRHSNSYMQRAWSSGKEPSFDFSVIVNCSPEWCICMEQFYINRHASSSRDNGYNLSPTAGSILGYKFSKEVAAANSARQKGKKLPEAQRLALAERHKARMADPAKKAEMVAILNRANSTPECLAKRADGIRRYWKNPDPEHRRKRDEASQSPEAKAKRLVALKNQIVSEETRRKLSKINKGRKFSDEVRARMSASAQRRHSCPEQRKKMAEIGAIGRESRRKKKQNVTP